MGLEIKTTAYHYDRSVQGRLHLDSKKLTFSGQSLKLSIVLSPDVKATLQGKRLLVSDARESISFDIGDDGKRWVDKILHPPDRVQKLGIQSEMKCWVSPGFDRAFRDELRSACGGLVRRCDQCDLAFLFLGDRDQLGRLVEACNSLPAGVNLWVVYPKGVTSITQTDVMSTAKTLGFGPSKTASFDDSLSGMRYAKRKS